MQNKSSVLQRKYVNATKNDVFCCCYFPTTKAKNSSKLVRSIVKKNMKILTLPSKYKLLKTHNAQNPQVFLVHSNLLNFTQIYFLNDFSVTSLKVKNQWYSPHLLKEAKLYQNPQHVCEVFAKKIRNIPLVLVSSFYFNIKSKTT